ncbi:hypothetical protein HYU18_02755 [Candidatus Woesearchaeota archaeon]|nr:hypothetical protein [Candidatus Woesearchaeota archaeon]
MKVFLEEAREELKRADHIIYVSLKYTRTVDVIKNLIERLINCLDFVIEKLLDDAIEKKLINEKPANIGLKCNVVKRIYGDRFSELVALYLHLRKISRAEYKKSSEYRRHVTMTATTDEGVFMIDIDKSKELYTQVKQMVEDAEKFISGEEEEAGA